MKVQQTYLEKIKLRGSDEVADILQEILDDGDDDYIDSLGDLCEIGGYPDEDKDPEYSIKNVKTNGSKVIFECDVYFDEKVYGGGCPDMPTIEPRAGTVTYELDLSTGEMHSISNS